MKRIILGIVVCCCFAGNPAYAAKYREVRLKDGTVFQAQIVSYHEGIYTLNVKDLGLYKVAEWNIDVIQFKNWDETVEEPEYGKRTLITPPGDFDRELERMRAFITTHPEIMKRILSLPNTPGIQHILENPVLMKALYFEEFDTLFTDPEFIRLLKSPTVQGLIEAEKVEQEAEALQQETVESDLKAQDAQTQMLHNIVIVQRILSLQNDPDVRKIFADPELMKAVDDFDVETLASSSEFRDLFHNTTVRKILDELAK